MATRRTHIYAGKVEKLIDQLTPEAKESWQDYATSAKTLLELQVWWNQRGFNPSLDSLSVWRRKHIRAGETAQAVFELLSKTKGIDAKGCLEFCCCISIVLANEIQEKLKSEYNRGDAQTLLNCLKESRSAAIALADLQSRTDRIESVLSGSYELALRCKNAAKGEPQSEWLELILQTGLTSIEDEIKSQTLAARV
ncbi:hypothetical protein ACEYW6_35825 [Nostoc sp. UIC 10607]|uniref:hypothetical protein n=1 Tax=Nostoc sp. UIC 10607 TaxID=3045935 RepID=UPI0039A211D3